MAKQFVSVGTVSVPREDGQASATSDLSTKITFTQRAEFDRVYSGVVTDDVVDLGTLDTGGAKAILVKCSVGTCTVKFNSDTGAWPLAPGALFMFFNPTVGFPTGCKVTTVGAATVSFLAVG